MKTFKAVFAAAAIILSALSGTALADDKAKVQVFYDFLSNPGSESHASALKKVVAEDWQSIGDYSSKTKSREKFIMQLGGFAKLIPDMNWKVEEILQDGNRYIVRGRATGTPKGPMFGVDGKGKGFEIMSIDIHTVEDGKIVKTYHVEDWAGALRQLKAQ